MNHLNNSTATDLLKNDIAKLEAKTKKEKLSKYKAKSISEVLTNLLNKVSKVDFHEKANKDHNRYISQSEYVVLIVEELNSLMLNTSFSLRSLGSILYLYNGAYWCELTADHLENFLTDIAIKMGVPGVKAKHNKFTKDLLLQFTKRAATPNIETNKKTLINLLNGTFEVTTEIQELKEPNKEDFIKYQLPFSYDKNAKCPLFDKFLNRVLPDRKVQSVLMEFLGYVFIKDFSLQKALILKGGGANGKSVFYDIVCAVLGTENVSTFSMQNITQSNSYHLPQLDNKLLNYSSEIGKMIDVDMFKKLVSNEEMDARRIYGEPFKFKSYAKLIFNCNVLPSNTEQTDAYFRRFLIIPFDQTIPKDEQNATLATEIIEYELSGIFNKILEGLQRVLKTKKFSTCETIDNQIDKYRNESDSVALFINENNYKQSSTSYSPLVDLYVEYKTYCVTNGYCAASNITFSRRLESLGYAKKRMTIGQVFNLEKQINHE